MTNEMEQPIENNEANEVTDPKSIITYIDQVLETYGISNIQESDMVEDYEMSVVPENPRAKNPEEFIKEHKQLLDDLGIEHDTKVHSRKRHITFTENGREEKLNFFTYEHNNNDSPKPIILFSHGGGIGGSANERSAYLRVLSAAGLNMSLLVAPDHRGSSSHLEKTRYSLVNRNIDLLLSLRSTLINAEDNWNGQIYLFGDSMGGHVSCIVAGILERNSELKDSVSLILTEPATYSKEAEKAPMTNFVKGEENLKAILKTEDIMGLEEALIGDILEHQSIDGMLFYLKFLKVDDGEKIFKISPLESAMQDGSSFSEKIRTQRPAESSDSSALEAMEKLERILLIQMTQDEIVPGDIRLLFDKIAKRKSEAQIVNIPTGHQATHVDEVKAIVNFIKVEN